MQQTEDDFRTLRRRLGRWEHENAPRFPWRNSQNHWHALVAEVMLQRTRAEQVVGPFVEFTRAYETPKAYLASRSVQVFGALGLLWWEEILRKLAKQIVSKGEPTSSSELTVLPGVGDYIAAAYRSLHLGLRDTIEGSFGLGRS